MDRGGPAALPAQGPAVISGAGPALMRAGVRLVEGGDDGNGWANRRDTAASLFFLCKYVFCSHAHVTCHALPTAHDRSAVFPKKISRTANTYKAWTPRMDS
jgi:hypothetical protein